MREIKFRAWDKEFNEMLEVDSIVFSDTLDFSTPHIIDSSNDMHPLSEVILMQYTGIKDKNGVEIYEGDIIEALVSPQLTERKNFEGLQSGIVEFEYGSFVIRFSEFNEIDLNRFPDCYLKVIGNIYENKNLLGNKNVRKI